MSKKQKNSSPEIGFEIMCPCCEATIRVDPVTRAVISHTPKPTPKTFADMEAAARAMREQDVRKESLFRQSVEAERNKADLLEKKFADAVKKAKEAPEPSKPFLRDFDLD
jgi:pyocin large subunit-like protein